MARSIEPETALGPGGWAGCFADNSWSTQWTPIETVMAALRTLRDGTWLKGHLGFNPVYEQYLYWHGASMGFVYRDLRDVLVSMTYHVTSEDEKKYFHPAKEIYRGMDKEALLLACLGGMDKYSGLFERWELYAPWLNVPWVFKLKFEDMINKPHEVARGFLEYVWDRTSWGYVEPEIPNIEDMIDVLVTNMKRTEMSGTFRKGQVGNWREEFTPRVKDEFKRRGGDWLIRLGYEKDDSW